MSSAGTQIITSERARKPVVSNSRVRDNHWLLPTALSAVYVVFLPVLLTYLPQLWTREHYRFFPFAFAATSILAVARGSRQLNTDVSASRWTLRLLTFLFAEICLVAGVFYGSPWLCFVGFVITLGLLLDFWNESNCDRSLWYLILPIVLIVRPPLNLDESAIHALQRLTSKFASSFLSAVHVDHILSGNIIQPIVGPALLVAEACSGVQSVFTLMFVAAFVGISRRYALARTILLIATSVFWALIMNVFRVIAIAMAQTQLQLDLTSGWKHEAVGYVGILLAICFMLSTDRLLLFFFGGIPDDPMKNTSVNLFVSIWNWLFVTPETYIADSGNIAGKNEHSSRGIASTRSALTRPYRIAAIAMAIMTALSAIPTWGLIGGVTFSDRAMQHTDTAPPRNNGPDTASTTGAQP